MFNFLKQFKSFSKKNFDGVTIPKFWALNFLTEAKAENIESKEFLPFLFMITNVSLILGRPSKHILFPSLSKTLMLNQHNFSSREIIVCLFCL